MIMSKMDRHHWFFLRSNAVSSSKNINFGAFTLFAAVDVVDDGKTDGWVH